MKTEKFLRIRIILFLVIHFMMCVIFAPLELILLILGHIFGKIYEKRPKLRYVTEKQFKSKLVRWYAGKFHGMYETDLRRKWDRNGKTKEDS
ncbi:hypothetical protein [Sebaldella sp. S0638]|uniref:hypothetical protein n=1 Tax=Sebaldella sp. S0638 TaxID=2957809 RepID=UPI00209DD2BC|nr:hypothetical protein [Sebaldella sp. S0638]MCP1225691.1 hypothetical protein [Sebaldella sp. S0638]